MNRHPITRPVTRRSALAGLGAGALGLALANGHLAAFAQDASPVATTFPTAGHPLVGAWQIETSDGVPPGATEYAIFDSNGNWVHYVWYGLAIGAWRPTGERTGSGVETYALWAEPLEILLDLSVPLPEYQLMQPPIRFRFDVGVDEGGNTFALEGVVVDDTGKDDPSRPGTLTAVRLVPATGATATPSA